MSDFRTQLDRIKADYESARYPGDLAALVLPAPLWRTKAFWRIAIPLAVAASMAIAFGVFWPRGNRPVVPDQRIADVTVIPPTTQGTTSLAVATDDTTMPATQSMPDSLSFPTELPTMPTGGDSVSSFPSSPTMPGFSSFTDTTVSEKEPT